MTNFLSSFILGSLEDNTGVFSTYWLLKNPGFWDYVGYPFGIPFNFSNTSEPLFLRTFFWLMLHFDPIVFYNVFVIVSLALTALAAYFFYKRLIVNKYISLMGALLLVFSPYFYFQYRSHLALIQFWLVVIFLFLLFKAHSWRNFITLGFFLTFVALISNYFAYFCLLVLSGYLLSKEFVYRLLGLRYWDLKVLFQYILCILVFSITFLPFLVSYFKFYGAASGVETSATTLPLGRSIEDFFIFTSRPWYYLLPSDINPFFGDITSSILSWMQNDWGYFLAQNYFRSEHTASYLGWVSLVMAVVGLRAIYKRVKSNTVSQPEIDLLVAAGVIVILGLFTMPPYLTLAGLKIYMPSYLLYNFFPMFRVLSRLGVVILLLLLALSTYGYKDFYLVISARVGKPFTIGLIILFGIISFMEYFVPLKVTRVADVPAVFEYIRNETPLDSIIAVYPHEKANLGQFWITHYERRFINPFGIVNTKDSFESEEFTENLNTCMGLVYAEKLGVDYVVVFGEELFLEEYLIKVQDFQPVVSPAPIYKFFYVSYAGADESSSLYVIRKGLDCEDTTPEGNL